jgi:pimeloyl-ACP methyl ester carboxylesterase
MNVPRLNAAACLQRVAHLGLVLAASMLLSACPPASSPPFVENTEDPKWVSQSDPHAKIAVVFVHGIFGSTLGTWSSPSGATFFQLLKDSPNVGSKVDVYAFGFTSKTMAGGSLDIREAANNMALRLRAAGVLEYPAVVLVGHSMGGLVVLRYLTSNLDKDAEFAAKVPLVVLYATPMEGANIAAIGNLVLRNPALAIMRPADSNAALQQLSDDWVGLVHKPKVICGYETRDIYGVKIVPWGSSSKFCSEAALAIQDEDHIGIVKPNRLLHPSVVMLTDALTRHVFPFQFSARLDTPDFLPEDDHFAFILDARQRNARLVNAGRARLKFRVEQVSDTDLFIVPDDDVIPGEGNQSLRLNLLAGADKATYEFFLSSDVPSKQRIVVHVPDLDRIRQQHADGVHAVVRALNEYLADPAQAAAIEALPSEEGTAVRKKVTKVAFDAMAKVVPGLPPAANWILTADALSSANWATLAAAALRQADAASSQTAGQPSAQRLARRIELQTGDKQLFIKGATTANDPKAPPTAPQPSLVKISASTSSWLNGADKLDASTQLASRLKRIPALRATGLSLEGDVLRAKGLPDAARSAYEEASTIEPTPSIASRLKLLEAPPASSKGVKASRLGDPTEPPPRAAKNAGTALEINPQLDAPRPPKDAKRENLVPPK